MTSDTAVVTITLITMPPIAILTLHFIGVRPHVQTFQYRKQLSFLIHMQVHISGVCITQN